jgi:hypothetical protein
MDDVLNPQSNTKVIFFAIAVLIFFVLLFAAFYLAWWWSRRPQAVSPYSGMPLRRASDLAYFTKEKIYAYLRNMRQYDNRPFKFSSAALCRETGRLFPNCVTWYDKIRLDWSFIHNRYPGQYVSWGSLTRDQQDAVRKHHDSLEGFQTEFSCSNPSPRLINPDSAYTKPGPLYVDVNTYVLLGWKNVPETEVEVLIIQKPKSGE